MFVSNRLFSPSPTTDACREAKPQVHLPIHPDPADHISGAHHEVFQDGGARRRRQVSQLDGCRHGRIAQDSRLLVFGRLSRRYLLLTLIHVVIGFSLT